MADNVSITAGSGTSIAADEISSVLYQRVKIALGADGAYDADLDSGQQVGASSVPVVLASDTDFIKAEDAAHSSGDKGIMFLGVRSDTLASLESTTGDYAPLQVNSSGALYISGQAGGFTIRVSAELTRPADTTTYGVGDVWSDSTSTTTPLALSGVGRVAGGSGYITGIQLVTNLKSVTPVVRLHLYNTNAITVSADNALFQEKYADVAKIIRVYDLPALSTPADTTNSDISRTDDIDARIPFTCEAASTTIYLVAETQTAFVPASGQKYTVVFHVEQN